MTAAIHHREQPASHACVPTCAAIVLSWLGRPAGEEDLRRGWLGSKRGYAIDDAATAVGGSLVRIYPHLPSFHDDLRARLDEPRWLIAYVFSAPMMRLTRALQPAPVSRFGALSREPYGELHAIVLVGADGDGFEYLDPFYPANGQPFRLTDEQIAEIWQGSMVISPPRAG